MALTGEQIKAKYLTEAEKNKNMHNPQPATTTPKPNVGSVPPNSYNPPSVTQPTAQPNNGYQPPAYGSNVVGYDSSNAQHNQLADAGQSWATAKASGDTAGMSAAAALGTQLRSGVQGASYDSVKGISTLPTPQPAQQVQPQAQTVGYTPPTTPNIMSMPTMSDIQQEAKANMDKQRIGLQQGVDKFIAGLQSGYDYSKANTADGRVLQDTTRTQTSDPFKNMGRTNFTEGLIGRQRSMEDGATDRQFNNELTAVRQQLLDFDRMAPEQQQALEQNLKRMAQQYGISLGQLMGEIPGMGRTLAGSAQDYAQSSSNPANVALNIQNQIAQLDLNSYPEQIKLGLDKLKQDVATGKLTHQEAEYRVKELTDPNSMTNQTKNLELKMAELEARNLPEKERLELQKLRKTIADIGVTHYKPQTEAEKQKELLEVDKIRAEIAKIENGTSGSVAPTKIDAKTSTDNYSIIQEDVDSGIDRATAKALLQANKDNLSDADYSRMSKYIDDNL